MITKTETREIFDNSKIGVGDIVEVEKLGGGFIGNKALYRHWAMVQRVEPEVLWLAVRHNVDTDRSYGIGVENSDKIQMIYRHPENEGRR